MLRTIGTPIACLAIGSAFTLGCVVAADADDIAGPTIVPSSGQVTATNLPDGSVYSAGAFASQALLTPCAGEDVEPHLPCRVLMRPTYVVGGDGVRHEVCSITLVNREDSTMVCADDTVWAS